MPSVDSSAKKMSIKPNLLNPNEPLHEQVYQQLKWSLIVGDYTPNDAISIRSIAASLGISTMPVREALKRLVSERAITASGNKTYRVSVLEPNRVADLFFIRSSLEGIATELAATLITGSQINRLEELAEKMDEPDNFEDFSHYLARNYSFHFMIYTASKNLELVAIIESLWAQTGPFLASGVCETGITPNSHVHRQIVDALRVRDAALARQLIEQDINWGTDVFKDIAQKQAT